MSIVTFQGLDQIGVVKDTLPFELPPGAWTDSLNIRFVDGKVQNTFGSVPAFNSPVPTYWLLHCFSSSEEAAWVLAGLQRVHAHISGASVDITRGDGDYEASEDGLWTGGVLGGIPILNNGFDVPQQWGPVAANQKLVNLENWPSNWRAASIRPFKAFLIAMNVMEDGVRHIHRVRTSHPAVPGSVPISWDAIDPEVDATRFDLTDVDAGPLRDGLQLRDLFILYKERATHGMQFIGGEGKFRNFPISEISGVLAKNCITVEPDGLFHFVATGEDVVLCDGTKIQSLLERREKKWIQANISSTTHQRSFCQTIAKDDECWFCFPMEGVSWCNMALVWNKRSNTISFREIPQLSFMGLGQLSTEGRAWDELENTWDEADRRWDELEHKAFARVMLGARPELTELLSMDAGLTVDGHNFNSFIERTGLSVAGASQSGEPASDLNRHKLVKRVWLQGTGGAVNIQIATQAEVNGPVVWSEPRPYAFGSQRAADFHEHALLWGIRISARGEQFSIGSFSVDVEPLGFF